MFKKKEVPKAKKYSSRLVFVTLATSSDVNQNGSNVSVWFYDTKIFLQHIRKLIIAFLMLIR